MSRAMLASGGPIQPIRAVRAGETARPGTRLEIEVADSARFLSVEGEWRELTERAWTPNVFMEPVVVAAAECEASATRTLLVWLRGGGQSQKLIGVWAFVLAHPAWWLPIPILRSPLNRHTHLGTPVVDRLHAREALAAIRDGLEINTTLPSVVAASDFETGPLLDLFLKVLSSHQLPWHLLETRRRAKLECGRDPDDYLASTLSRARRKRLASLTRRLQTLGRLEHQVLEGHDDVCAAFEKFLDLEASGWKADRAKRGHAFRLRPQWTAVARHMVAGLADHGLASVHSLALDGRSVAMQVLFRSGNEAYTWRTAYDQSLRAYGPGLVLLETYTRHLLRDPRLARVDSCNRRDTGVMVEFWSERREVADLLVGARGRNPAFTCVSAVSRSQYRAKDAARAARDRLRSAFQKGR